MGELTLPAPPAPAGRVRLAHLTTVDMSLAWLLAGELRADVDAGLEVFGISAPGQFVSEIEALGVTHVPVHHLTRSWDLAADVAAARELATSLAASTWTCCTPTRPKPASSGGWSAGR